MADRTQQEAIDFLIRAGIIRPNERTLEGQEKKEVWMLLQLLEIDHSTNNQRFWTDYYKYGNKEYSVTFFDENDFEIVEIVH